MKDEKVKDFPGVFNAIIFAQAAKDMIAMAPYIAQVYRVRYLSLVKEGFTEEQALRIIMSRGLEG